jgi:serine/threonine protein kinase
MVSSIRFGTTKLAEYDQMDVLGKGTYGEVTKCLHRPTATVVALKTFLFENKKNGCNYSTMRELSLTKQLSNYPNFVRLLDVIEETNTEKNLIHAVFEFCARGTLFKKLAKRSHPLDWGLIKDIMV